MITLSDALPGDEAAIAALCTELDEFYGSLPQAPAGFAAYSFLWPAVGLTASLHLKELYIAEAYRRAGVGRLLMDGLYDVARSRGLSRVEWTTDTSNGGAQAFYESLGARSLASKIPYRAVPSAAEQQAAVGRRAELVEPYWQGCGFE